MSSDCEGKSSWPELVGAQGVTAAATIERENPLVDASVLLDGTPVIRNFDCTRVWVWVDEDGVVTKVPKIDPLGKLASWTFSTNTSVTYVCQLVGISCWNDKNGRILRFQLDTTWALLDKSKSPSRNAPTFKSSISRAATSSVPSLPNSVPGFPSYLVTLDLSGNQLFGSIPPDITDKWGVAGDR
ncbi:hypothetical protein Vadar_017730 [Vaccinium darrowii]|uniref:Uncharacterized protein n=1 Tax=Vaccinium darrowii TaxID=229202 RepID=A0ACB7Y0N1_9ERIC|nr:hypothetical protein Vadar_017730 [Vaccinium darrowii]